MSGGPFVADERKPAFTRDQIINATDVQRKWRTVIEPKLNHMPFLLMFSGTEPKTTVLSYDKFEELWRKAEEASELSLQLELATRVLSMIINKDPLVSFVDVVAKTAITAADLEGTPDVELETD